MAITVLSIGKKHEKWIEDGVDRYSSRLRKPFDLTWRMLPHSSSHNAAAARDDESQRLFAACPASSFVVVLDERGKMLSSPQLASTLGSAFTTSHQVSVIIGGAYGVNDQLRERAQLVWSLSDLVFPHQLVRLILTEQIYRAQEIHHGRPYHHA